MARNVSDYDSQSDAESSTDLEMVVERAEGTGKVGSGGRERNTGKVREQVLTLTGAVRGVGGRTGKKVCWDFIIGGRCIWG